MANLAPVVLKGVGDAKFTFTPRNLEKGTATLAHSTGIPAGDKRVAFGLTRTQTGKTKTFLRLTVPQLAQVAPPNGVVTNTVARTGYLEVSATFDNTSTAAERQEPYELLRSSIDAPMLGLTVFQLEDPY